MKDRSNDLPDPAEAKRLPTGQELEALDESQEDADETPAVETEEVVETPDTKVEKSTVETDEGVEETKTVTTDDLKKAKRTWRQADES